MGERDARALVLRERVRREGAHFIQFKRCHGHFILHQRRSGHFPGTCTMADARRRAARWRPASRQECHAANHCFPGRCDGWDLSTSSSAGGDLSTTSCSGGILGAPSMSSDDLSTSVCSSGGWRVSSSCFSGDVNTSSQVGRQTSFARLARRPPGRVRGCVLSTLHYFWGRKQSLGAAWDSLGRMRTRP